MKILTVCLMLFATLFLCSGAPALAQTGTPTGIPVSGAEVPEWQARLELADLLAGTGRFGEAEAQYRKVLADQPGNVPANHGLARVLAWSGKNDEATALFAKLPDANLTADDRLLLADFHIGRKEYDKAVAQLEAVLKERPEADDARLKLAEVLSWSGKLDQSIDQYVRILDRHPDDVQVRRKYAQVLSWAGRNADAIQELKRTLD